MKILKLLTFLVSVVYFGNMRSLAQTSPFYIGTYTNNQSRGIYESSINAEGKFGKLKLVALADNPSFLAKSVDGKYLLAVNENAKFDGQGRVSSFKVQNGTLVSVNSELSGGAYPCHITINKRGHVLTANYGDGTVALFMLSTDGQLLGPLDVQRHKGQGTTDRQKGPHAHSVWFDNSENKLVSVDLGTNELWFSEINAGKNELSPREPYKLSMDVGAGPRHMTFHPNRKWAYVLNELSSTVTVLRKSKDDIYAKGESVSTLPADFDGKSFCADIHISSDGKFLYASNRGHNSIAIYQVSPKTGSLGLIGIESTRGEIPRNFSISPDDKYVIVANQKTNSLVSFARDRKNGMLKFVDEIPVPTPVCILF